MFFGKFFCWSFRSALIELSEVLHGDYVSHLLLVVRNLQRWLRDFKVLIFSFIYFDQIGWGYSDEVLLGVWCKKFTFDTN